MAPRSSHVTTGLALLAVCLMHSSAKANAAWFDQDWDHRVLITADAAQIESAESWSDFALLVSLTDSEVPGIFSGARSDGADLLFTKADGVTPLGREVVSFDTQSGRAEIWVRMDTFSKTENQLYLYYGNPAANLPANPADAWSSEYRLVYHFEDDPGTGVLTDSSPQDSHAFMNPLSNWTSGDVTDTPTGRGWNFNGTTHHVNSNSISTQDSSYVISTWLEHTSVSSDFVLEANPGFWHISSQVTPGSNPDYAASDLNVVWQPRPIEVNDGYHQFTWAFDAVSDTVVFYYDGVPRPIWAVWNPGGQAYYTGRLINPAQSEPVGILGSMWYGMADNHRGGVDEFIIREGVASGNRILTEFRSQNDNAGFLDIGAEEDAGTATGIAGTDSRLWMRAYPNPSPGRSTIRFALVEEGPVRIAVYDLAGRRVRTLVDRNMLPGPGSSSWDGRGDNGRPLPAGVYFLRLQTAHEVRSLKVSLVR